MWNLHILWETVGFSHCPKTFIVSRVLPHFKPRQLGNGWTEHNPASSLWPLDILQYLYLVLQGLSVVLARIFLLLIFFQDFQMATVLVYVPLLNTPQHLPAWTLSSWD